MPPKSWKDCLDIFSEAVDRPHNARSAVLDQTCNGDKSLRRRVELLLKYHDESGDFIDTPAFVAVPELLIDDPNMLIGQHVGRYRIDELLGRGGMGVVYLAFDERLERNVGLKLLSQSRLAGEGRWERLKQEARTASALNHPNIMTVHEVGEVDSVHYIATEFIEGSTLRKRINQGPIPAAEALEIATQIAQAICAAHAVGIVHRDIKPENIMLRPDGYVKVLDFGIARFAQKEPFATTTLSGQDLSIQRGILGTARYISPEQARNQAVDNRSDLWSLGVVLYEMLAAHPPFDGETPTTIKEAVLLTEPEPIQERVPGASPGWQKVLEKALTKDPSERYQTIEELLGDLRKIQETSIAPVAPSPVTDRSRKGLMRWAGIAVAVALLGTAAVLYGGRSHIDIRAQTPPPAERGIAVLPFENLSADSTDAFLAGSLQDDILTGISKVRDLKVIARASVMEYDSGSRSPGKIREIGRALGISHVLEGSVRKVADRVVINVALIDASDERLVWSERYERMLTDAVSLQGELAIEIARELRATLTPTETTMVSNKPTQNPQAYLAYLRAREVEMGCANSEQLQAAAELYQKAVDLDPSFALAHARLSLCASQVFYANAPPEWKARARVEAEEALRLRPELGEAWLALAHCHVWADGDDDRALGELKRTRELLPNSAEVPLAEAFIYKRQKRYHDRFAALRRAEALDPRNLRVLGYLTNTLRWVRNWPEALETFDRIAAVAGDKTIRSVRWSRANDEFRLTGDISVLKKALAAEENAGPPVGTEWLNLARYQTAMLERDYESAGHFLSAATFRDLPDCLSAHAKVFHEALLAVAANRSSKQQALEVAAKEAESRLNTYNENKPDADLAVLYAFLGRKEQAIRRINDSKEIWLGPAGTIEKNDIAAALALVYAQTGEPDKAIELIEHLLTVPIDLQRGAIYNMTLTDLKWGWQWDPLRNHPRFQKILAAPEPKTVY